VTSPNAAAKTLGMSRRAFYYCLEKASTAELREAISQLLADARVQLAVVRKSALQLLVARNARVADLNRQMDALAQEIDTIERQWAILARENEVLREELQQALKAQGQPQTSTRQRAAILYVIFGVEGYSAGSVGQRIICAGRAGQAEGDEMARVIGRIWLPTPLQEDRTPEALFYAPLLDSCQWLGGLTPPQPAGASARLGGPLCHATLEPIVRVVARRLTDYLTTSYPAQVRESERSHHLRADLEPLVTSLIQPAPTFWESLAKYLYAHLQVWAAAQMTQELGPAAIKRMPPAEQAETFLRYVRADSPLPLLDRITVLAEAFAQKFADALIAGSRERYDSWGAIEVMLGWREPGKDLVTTANGPVFYKIRDAVAGGKRTWTDGGRWPLARLTTKNKTLQAVARLQPDPHDIEPYLEEAELAAWRVRMGEQVQAMGDLTADVLDIIMIVWLEHRDAQGFVEISADTFLRYRGVLKHKSGTGRRGGYKAAQRQEIARQVSILSNLWITVADMEVVELVEGKEGKIRKRGTWRGQSRAIVVTSQAGRVAADGTLHAYAWRIRPGEVLMPFLSGPGRQLALLPRKTLEYHPNRQTWEKRLTRYFAWFWRIQRKTGVGTVYFRTPTLLGVAKQRVMPKRLKRIEARLVKALDRLQSDGTIAGWEYVDEDISFLDRQVCIRTPQAILAGYAQSKRPGRTVMSSLPADAPSFRERHA
jgi:hypothetical protein